MKGWLRLVTALAAGWVFFCSGLSLFYYLSIPSARNEDTEKPEKPWFFHVEKIESVLVEHPSLGKIMFPATMTRPEIERVLHENNPRRKGIFAELSNQDTQNSADDLSKVRWNVPAE